MDPRTQLPAPLICPKCQGAMRAHERSGITVDHCAECRGIFLDRGELERLLDAEAPLPILATADSAQPDDFRRSFRGSRPSDDDVDERLEKNARDRHGDAYDWSHDGPSRRDRELPRDGQRINGRRESRFGGLLDLFGGGD